MLWDQTLSVHEGDTYEYQSRLSCTQTAAEVCHKVWVVMHDLQSVHPMVVCCRVQLISLGDIQVNVVMVARPVHR